MVPPIRQTRLQIAAQSCSNCNRTPTAGLHTCSRCHNAQYCDATCQKANFKAHKPLCKALAEINEMYWDDFADGDITAWNETVTKKLGALELYLSRELEPSERNLVLFEPKCQSCFLTGEGLRRKKEAIARLMPCDECRIVLCCSEECWDAVRDQHRIACGSYKLAVECDEILFELGTVDGHGTTWAPEDENDEAQSKELSLGWDEYFLRREAPSFTEPFTRCVTDKLSRPLTILSALGSFYGLEQMQQWDELTIHICGGVGVGVGLGLGHEILGLLEMEEIQHNFVRIKVLHLVLVDQALDSHMDRVALDMCSRCVAAGRRRLVSVVGEAYHKFAASSDYKPPKLTVGFNSGPHDDNDDSDSIKLWRPTIEMLVETGVPCLLTSYNMQKSEKDATMLRSAGAHIIFGPKENVWKSLVPLPEPTKIDEFYYNNFWMVGFRGSVHGDS